MTNIQDPSTEAPSTNQRVRLINRAAGLLWRGLLNLASAAEAAKSVHPPLAHL